MAKIIVNLDAFKQAKILELKRHFDKIMTNLKLKTSLGFYVDNRKYENKDDLRNLDCLLETSNFPVMFRDSDNQFHEITFEECKLIKKEMQQQILDMYNKKWEYEKIIQECKSAEELSKLKIEFNQGE